MPIKPIKPKYVLSSDSELTTEEGEIIPSPKAHESSSLLNSETCGSAQPRESLEGAATPPKKLGENKVENLGKAQEVSPPSTPKRQTRQKSILETVPGNIYISGTRLDLKF